MLPRPLCTAIANTSSPLGARNLDTSREGVSKPAEDKNVAIRYCTRQSQTKKIELVAARAPNSRTTRGHADLKHWPVKVG